MTIGEVARKSGLSTSAIRYYESAGVLPVPPRKSGIRQYDDSWVDQLKLLHYCRRNGIPVERLCAIFGTGTRRSWKERQRLIRAQIAELDRSIEQAEEMKTRLHALLDCRCGGDQSKCVVFQE